MIDIDFIEFYIKKKYSQKLEDYFNVTKSISSKWRNKNFPVGRLHEFMYREGTINIEQLIFKIYDRQV